MSRVFAAAAALDGVQRAAYLAEACRGDAALRAVVASMLAGHEAAGSFGDEGGLPRLEGGKRLAPGSHLGAFRIESLLGAGGMGEVYRAYDTRLQRAVALKVLPEALALDPDRRRRFEQEALALASLNHSNVGAIYGLEEAAGVTALVLELVEGPTLADCLAGGPLPPAEAASIARQIAEALEAAHEHGIIHRDLKPANIKITPEGIVKVLDFGLAKAARAPAPAPAPAALETHTRAAGQTAIGLVVGTAAYMSPEQARGQPVDRRTDIWAFGCVLFEMLAGRPPFAGDTITDTLAAVIEREPDWTSLPAATPPAVARLIRRCLIKDPRLRLRDIGEARIALTPGLETGQERASAPPPRTALMMAGIAGAGVAAWLGVGLWDVAPASVPIASPVSFLVPPPDGTSFVRVPARTFLALSPDGSQLAFVAGGPEGSRVWLRAMAELQARPVSGTEGALSVFWSPDGRALAFFADGKLKRVDLRGGAAVTICDVPAAGLAHGTWGADGVILFGTTQGAAIFRVAAAGGLPAVWMTPDQAHGDVRVHWPWFLPDGRRLLYTVRRSDGEGELRLGTLGGDTRALMPASSNAQWVDPDIVVFVRDGVLMGQRVELAAAQTIGEPFAIADRVDYLLSSSRAMFSAARTGTIAYHSGGDRSQLVWADRTGNELGRVGAPADYPRDSARLSADDGMLLVSQWQAGPGTHDIWRFDLARGTDERLTDNRGSEVTPVFSEDGREVFFSADRGGSIPTLFRKDLVTGVEQPLIPGSGMQQLMMDVIPGQRAIVFTQRSRQGTYDIFRLPLAGGPPSPLVESRADKSDVRVSPDGRALAFVAFDAGRSDLYVAPLPVTSPPIAAAAGLSGAPRWSRDGRQLYYIGPGNDMMAVAVQTGPPLHVGSPRRLFELKQPSALLDVSRDGRFLLLVPVVRAAEQPISVAIAAVGVGPR